jgi:hypothetical protein
MLPEPKDMPAHLPECFCGLTVSYLVAADFTLPVAPVSRWHSAMPSTAMPEAAVHEDGETFFAKHEVRFARQWLVPTPAVDSASAEDTGEFQFSRFVSLRPNCCHDLRAFLFAEHVCHTAI